MLAAHGSANPAHAATMAAIATGIRRALRSSPIPDGTDVLIGYLDHGTPLLSEVNRPGDVVLPMLLSSGVHVTVDIPRDSAECTITPALGPDPRLAWACAERLREVGWTETAADRSPVVLAAAGSTQPEAIGAVEATADALADILDVEVTPAYLSAAAPDVFDVVTPRTNVAAYLLAPGQFADKLSGCGGLRVADVLGAHPSVVSVAVSRIVEAWPSDVREMKPG